MSTDIAQERLTRRIQVLYASDPQFAAARPDEAVSAAMERPGLRLPQLVQTVMDGYANRPALGQRAVQLVTDPDTGRTTAELLPRFEMLTYRELWQRAGAIASAWTNKPVRPGDRVCVLGFTSVDYTVIDVALIRLGAVAVPLQTSASANAAGAHCRRDRAEHHRGQHRSPFRRGRTGADRPHPHPSGCVRPPSRG